MMVIFSALVALALVVSTEGNVGPSSNGSFCSESKECVEYELICKTEEYEVRHYSPTRWVSTDAEAYFMGVGAAMAFRRLFQYITGANDAGVQMEMTAPVLVKIPEETKLWEPAVYTLSFPLPSAYQHQPPSPTNDKLYFTEMPGMDVYVRSYGGWMLSITSRLHTHLLTKELSRVQASYNHTFHYGVGYDSPLKLVNRHNEVWYVAEGQPVCTDPQEPTPAHTTTPTPTLADSSPTDAPPDSPPHTLSDSPPHTLSDSPPHTLSDSPPHALSDSPPHALPDSPPQALSDVAPLTSAMPSNLSSVAPPSNLSSSSVAPSNVSSSAMPSSNNLSSVAMPANLSLMPSSSSSNLSSVTPSDDLPSPVTPLDDDLSSSSATPSNVSSDTHTPISSSSVQSPSSAPSSSSLSPPHDAPAPSSSSSSTPSHLPEEASSSFSDPPTFAHQVVSVGDPTTSNYTSSSDDVSSSSSSSSPSPASPSLESHAADAELWNNTVHAGSPETQADSQ